MPFSAKDQDLLRTVGELASMAHLGPKSATMLAQAGITSAEHLAMLGSVAAFAMVKRSGARVSLNLLWAIEGALTGQSWQTVASLHRASLLLALDSLEADEKARGPVKPIGLYTSHPASSRSALRVSAATRTS
jgi:DNA transformation protein